MKQAILTGGFAALVAAEIAAGFAFFPSHFLAGGVNAYEVLVAITIMAGSAAAVSADRVRRGREIGAWRFLAFFFPPVAIPAYVAVEYRARAIWLAPAALLAAALPVAVPLAVGLSRSVPRGDALLEKDDLRGAAREYAKSLRWGCRADQAYVGRARVLGRQGDLAAAERELGKALDLNPRNPDAYYNRALSKRARGDALGAGADLQRALEFAPADWPYRPDAEKLLRLR
jgi:tetratricopeptide (TPR) repeat protein